MNINKVLVYILLFVLGIIVGTFLLSPLVDGLF